jgi:two-component system cell cycle sensor histidine kinase/response regulator CckA
MSAVIGFGELVLHRLDEHDPAHPQVEQIVRAGERAAAMTDQLRVFEPFFTTKEEGKGTGLGLATVFGIVTQSDGNDSVYSEPGRGTTFKVLLPRAERHAALGEQQRAPQAPPRGSETVLLVEDEELVRDLEQQVLEQCGYVVLEAGTPTRALEIADGHPGPIHLLLTDVVMPEMSGRELVERLSPARPEMKILYASGYADDAVVRHGVLEAEVAFLTKPFTPASFGAKVREVLDAKHPTSRAQIAGR